MRFDEKLVACSLTFAAFGVGLAFGINRGRTQSAPPPALVTASLPSASSHVVQVDTLSRDPLVVRLRFLDEPDHHETWCYVVYGYQTTTTPQSLSCLR